MLDDFRLRIFEEVARQGSFTTAARRLGISQSAVSQNIAELEKRLGTRLLERGRGDVTLTSAGKSFREYAAKITYWYDAAQDVFRAMSCGSAETVRIAAGKDIVSTLLSEIIRPFAGTDGYCFDISTVGCGSQSDMSDDGADLYLTSAVMAGSLPEAGADIAGTSPLCAVSCPSDPDVYRGVSALSDIRDKSLAVWSGVPSYIGDSPRTVFRSDSPEAVISAVRSSGRLIGVLPLYCVKKELADRTLVRLPLSDIGDRVAVFLKCADSLKGTAFYKSFSQRLEALLDRK